MCLETQFDCVIVDRPMVLQSLYQLHNSLSDRKILSWEFFLNRFDALFLEAQLNMEKTSGDVSYLRGNVKYKSHNHRKYVSYSNVTCEKPNTYYKCVLIQRYNKNSKVV